MDYNNLRKKYFDAYHRNAEELQRIKGQLEKLADACRGLLPVEATVELRHVGYAAVVFRKDGNSTPWAAYVLGLNDGGGTRSWEEGVGEVKFDGSDDGDPRFLDPEVRVFELLGEWVAKVEFAAGC